jgi:uncharacterized protein (UPF0335 family)
MLVGIGFVAPEVEEIEREETVAVSELRAITERLDRIEAALAGTQRT